jgi:hypothetical protein
MLNESDFEEMVDVESQKRCEEVCSLIRNTTIEEFEEWLAFDNARRAESLTYISRGVAPSAVKRK